MITKINRLSEITSYGFDYVEDMHCYKTQISILGFRFTGSGELLFIYDGYDFSSLSIHCSLFESFSVTDDCLYIYELND